MICNKQLDAGTIMLDRQGLLVDPAYIARAGRDIAPARQNVATLPSSVSAVLLVQFVSLVVAPGGLGEPGPLRYWLSTHQVEHLDILCRWQCPVESAVAAGDPRQPLIGSHLFATG
jgi:molybdopterin-synthase adenylyltransferase